jgi:hypothetical protein
MGACRTKSYMKGHARPSCQCSKESNAKRQFLIRHPRKSKHQRDGSGLQLSVEYCTVHRPPPRLPTPLCPPLVHIRWVTTPPPNVQLFVSSSLVDDRCHARPLPAQVLPQHSGTHTSCSIALQFFSSVFSGTRCISTVLFQCQLDCISAHSPSAILPKHSSCRVNNSENFATLPSREIEQSPTSPTPAIMPIRQSESLPTCLA